MLAPYLTFDNNACEEAFHFYAEAFGGGTVTLARLNNEASNPVMHASVQFTRYEGCVMGADAQEPPAVRGMAICAVLPSRQAIEAVCEKLAAGGRLLQAFAPHPPPHQDGGGAAVLDRYGYTWYLST